MRIFFDDNNKIIAVSDGVDFDLEFANQIYCPFRIQQKLNKTVTVYKQKTDATGFALFLTPDKEETRLSKIHSVDNHAIVEPVTITRSVGLFECPTEWTLNDVLQVKYSTLAGNKDYWFDEFFETQAIDFNNSQCSAGFNGVSVSAKGALQLVPLKLKEQVGSVQVYLESDKPLKIEASADGLKFIKADKSQVITLSRPSDTIVFRLINTNDEAIPLDAFAIFY
jgi:hypothetical protein